MYCLLNLLAFLFHGILSLADEDYQQARAKMGRRTEFFSHMRAGLWYALHEDWTAFIIFVKTGGG
jgi:hypothetical protein